MDPLERKAYVAGAVASVLLRIAILAVMLLGGWRILSAIFETRRLTAELVSVLHEVLVKERARCP
jgi:hypothetical protein